MSGQNGNDVLIKNRLLAYSTYNKLISQLHKAANILSVPKQCENKIWIWYTYSNSFKKKHLHAYKIWTFLEWPSNSLLLIFSPFKSLLKISQSHDKCFQKRSTIHKIQILFILVNLYLFTAIGYVCTIVHYQVYNGKELGKQ